MITGKNITMKAIKGLIIFLAAGLLAGCIKDDRSDCIDENANLVLNFEYFDLEGKDIFADRIDVVDLVIFDEFKNFYAWIPISQQELEEFQGYRMEVEPGDYYMVCWANNRSSGNGDAQTPGMSYLYHSNPETADPLHYAPDKRFVGTDEGTRTRSLEDGTWKLTVAPTGTTEDTMGFMSAHRTVNVYMKDFPGMDGSEPAFPEVTINNLSAYYDFTLARSPETTYFVQTSNVVTVEGERYCYASFYIPHFDYDDDIDVVITGNGEYSYNYSIPMEEILELHEVTELFDGDDLVLDVEVTWLDGTLVKIEIPPFLVNDVGGKFD